MPRIKNPKVQPYGHHSYQPIFGFVEPDPGLGFDGKRIMGVTLSSHFIYGSFRSLDGKKYFSFVRHYNNHGALGFTAFGADTDTNGKDSDFSFNTQSKNAYVGAVMATEQDGAWGVRDIFEGPPRFEVRATPAKARWFERDLVDVTAEALGSVIQTCVPDSTWPLVYNTRCMKVKGTFLGHEVQGWMQMDNAYLPDGKDWYAAPYLKDLQGAWTDFATEYEDGAVDHGMLFCGRERFNAFCVESTDRPPVIVIDPDIQVELDDNEYLIRLTVDTGDGEIWEWQRVPSGKAKIPSTTIEDSPRWIQGCFVRRNETRAIKSADAWMETSKSKLIHLL